MSAAARGRRSFARLRQPGLSGGTVGEGFEVSLSQTGRHLSGTSGMWASMAVRRGAFNSHPDQHRGIEMQQSFWPSVWLPLEDKVHNFPEIRLPTQAQAMEFALNAFPPTCEDDTIMWKAIPSPLVPNTCLVGGEPYSIQ
jgi:hypothetical protein